MKDILLSNWSFSNKVRALFALELNAVQDKTGMRLLESQLEELGHAQLAQVVRWYYFCNQPKESIIVDRSWSEDIVKGDIMMRLLVQREIYLQEETRALQKLLVLDEANDKNTARKAQLEKYEAELECLNDVYWEISRAFYKHEANISYGVLKRAFDSCRADPEWYLNQWLREDCARRGGCCGRGCRCCERPRTNNRQWNRGQCTTTCGCCVRKQQRSYEFLLLDRNDSSDERGPSDESEFSDENEIEAVDIASELASFGRTSGA